MKRGTTPTLSYTLPFECGNIDTCYLTFVQGSTQVLNKTLTDMAASGNTLTISLTQADTLALTAGVPVEMQLRIKTTDGNAIASAIMRTTAERILKDGEI